MVTEAGKGEHHYYVLKPANFEEQDTDALEVRKHYLGIDAVRWYVNEQGNFFRDRMASGTVQLSLADEMYEVGLGTYQLEAGARTAPVFDRAILPNRRFRGGRITFKIFVRAIQSDTVLGGLLRELANVSLDVAIGAVGAATAAGPMAVLLTAGTNLAGGVKKVLSDGKNAVTVFDPEGVDVNFRAADLKGPVNYVLVHRGAELDAGDLSLTRENSDVVYKGNPLDDGAWILFRLRREDRYASPRPWDDEARHFRGEMKDVMDRFSLGGISLEDSRNALTPTRGFPPNLADRLMDVVAKIRNDYVLAEAEATLKAGMLISLLKLAQRAVNENNAQKYNAESEVMASCISEGREPTREVADAFSVEARDMANARANAEAAPELYGENLWSTMRRISGRTDPRAI